MSKNRIRCNQCQKNFCAACSTEPYHIGKTCEQHKNHKEARKCRYCDEEIKQAPPSAKPAFKNVCRKTECMNAMNETCEKVLACGHPCGGFRDELICMPCLNPECARDIEVLKGQDADEYCPICYVEGLGVRPAVRLDCGHIFHVACIMQKIKQKWPGPRIVFGFLDCS